MTQSSSSLPTVRWGIIATGLISGWFVKDILLQRKDARAKHVVSAIGASNLSKGNAFAQEHLSGHPETPKVYGTYAECYQDPDVDVIYIGTPHAFHKQNCLDAIAAGKHVLCEKAFALNAYEAEEVVEAARQKGVFLMEGMWTRFTPLVRDLRKALFEDKLIGSIRRTFCDFGLDINIASLPAGSRYKDLALGAGSLLDIGIYSLTWGLVTLDAGVGDKAEMPKVVASQSLVDGVDVSSSIVLQYPSTGCQGILTSTTDFKSGSPFCRIEGSKGYVLVHGPTPSAPRSFSVWPKNEGAGAFDGAVVGEPLLKKEYELEGMGFYYEADAVAVDITSGKRENEEVMPLSETLRVMRILDEVRRQGGARFPQDPKDF